ncbi:MAG: hypothetical protein CL768_00380 [Chloroflexi bacterium]|nr:hypothetical protein [Chloroflexota bacterium]|tara:strand:+ start:1401 stop:1949 length:549 start_codon:yes stop_codon:yes gene_type:complete
MKRFVQFLAKIVGGSLVLIILVVISIFTVARFSDGPIGSWPIEMVTAGPFKSGDLYDIEEEPDWNFLKEYPIVQFQLINPPRSRTTFIMETGGRIFIPSGYMNSTIGKIWKHWPMEAEEDGRALLRVDEKIYERTMVRIEEGDILKDVLSELSRKYAGGFPVSQENIDSGDLWIFELEPRDK